ncbi:iron chelate uptake ABC transporter family permease subunit [Dietzia sp. 2505]|uniref:FecCD family ABC transporter permease n=1 Tax=Dietzia sp. 2505 TaxID=3156457 RepID=UPI0033941D8C
MRLGRYSRSLPIRDTVVALIAVVVVLALVVVALSVGERTIPLGRVLGAFAPGADRVDAMVVVEWRAPRALAAAVFGACLGVSGALFQSLTRNALGSPDIIGLNTGAFTGVLVAISLGCTGYAAFATGALTGGVLTAALVYLLAYSAGLQGFRLIIVGIAISAFLGSVNTWIIVKSDLDVALRAAVWGAGSLNGVRWPQLIGAGASALVLASMVPWLTRVVRQLELGDESAQVRGVRPEPGKAAVVLVGVALTSLVTAVTGPISFIALSAPQIARRLRTRSGGVDPVGSALTGAVLLSAADLLAQHALPMTSVPVGAVTVCLGGAYLIYLLLRENERS